MMADWKFQAHLTCWKRSKIIESTTETVCNSMTGISLIFTTKKLDKLIKKKHALFANGVGQIQSIIKIEDISF